MKIGVLTGGGDAPGLNAAIRGITRKALNQGFQVVGIRNGWLGLLEQDTVPLGRKAVTGILPQGGTILGSTRTNPYKREGGSGIIKKHMTALGLDALVPIGGEDTLGVALRLSREGVKVVAVPKTVDNDLSGTDFCIGFDTAVNEVMRAIDRLHPTAEAHHRVMLVEVMGRSAGWIATLGGIAGGADVVVTPEFPVTTEEICQRIRQRHQGAKRTFSIVVVAEGVRLSDFQSEVVQESRVDEFGHVRLGGIGHLLASEIERRTGYETRVTVLGHTQRGGSPSAFDRLLATRLGVCAVEQVAAGNFGVMVVLKGHEMRPLRLEEGLLQMRRVDRELYDMAQLFS